MDALTNAVRDKRARPVAFELPDGTVVDIDPPTLAQVRACVRLDPRPGQRETAAQQVERIGRQAEIILGPAHARLLDDLQPLQVAEVVGALYVATTGLSPESYVRWQQQQRRAVRVATAHELLEQLEVMSIDLAARLGKMPSEVDQMPMADAVALRERIAEVEKAKANLQAAIAGVELRWG